MRDPNRLDNLYDTMKQLHKEKIPDWRMFQFLANFLGWVYAEHGDPFYFEDDKFLKLFKEYLRCEDE